MPDEGGDDRKDQRRDDDADELAHAAEHDQRHQDGDPLPVLGREEGEDEADQRAGGAGEPEPDAESDERDEADIDAHQLRGGAVLRGGPDRVAEAGVAQEEEERADHRERGDAGIELALRDEDAADEEGVGGIGGVVTRCVLEKSAPSSPSTQSATPKVSSTVISEYLALAASRSKTSL